MKKEYSFFNGLVVIGRNHLQMFVVIFIAALIAKGSVIFRGHAVDDYAFLTGVGPETLGVFVSQGRYVAAASVWLVQTFGANIADMYFPFGLVTLFLQTAFIVSIFRFVGVADSPTAGLVGAIVVTHPYLAEILTFRMALPFYGVALVSSIICLEILIKNPVSQLSRAFALMVSLAMIFTYQVFVNYYAVAIIAAAINWRIVASYGVNSSKAGIIYRDRAIGLAIVSVISTTVFIAVTWMVKAMGLTAGTGRSSFISSDQIPERLEQVSSSLIKIYWSAEPVFPGWLKTIVAMMLFMSVAVIIRHVSTSRSGESRLGNVIYTIFALLLLIPVSLGVILPFDDWWPVPRVVAHVSLVIGLILLIGDSCMRGPSAHIYRSVNLIIRVTVLVGFVLLSNQIFADQQRLNQWDRMMANRIVSRLEMSPNFRDIRFVYLDGGTWGYPARLRTVQGDMNISALFPDYSKVPLLSEVSGYGFEEVVGPKAAVGKKYCEDKLPWPHVESITVFDDLAIVCLKQNK
jgi:hypothetical protein